MKLHFLRLFSPLLDDETIRETIRKDLEVNELDSNLVYDTTL